ncbi:MAG TPA: 50S ribosomal protein L28, partial [Candidatus Syntrophosphaera thermopropionivorans]|nr:50S ribosomal protein L28 [Candidatus Syntrophosphaera thermopropionivorans]
MSKVCDICGKKAQVGNLRSHALNATKRRFYPNLHLVRAVV